ncbi:hypothetical protein PN498_03910 [Oscillatoria sp. CS-180]|uniref:hypothetical protein n=1 Tax=Oscillatoria sp. CS-180 TaxID=3021720 RepID=UPI00233099C7|nr:hypothetical protein [Oscillatoria sp. CS-180]MDB9525121.1 hypothetical protein [Oscillatoria sp. CS-180]
MKPSCALSSITPLAHRWMSRYPPYTSKYNPIEHRSLLEQSGIHEEVEIGVQGDCRLFAHQNVGVLDGMSPLL